MSRILYLTIVKEYYRQNALFIFAVMMFAFGFLRAAEHLALIRQAFAGPLVMGVFCLLWAMHGAKVIFYAVRALGLRENEFLHHIRAFTVGQRLWSFARTVFLLQQLTFLYAVAMGAMALHVRAWTPFLIIAGVNLLIVLAGAVIMEWSLRKFFGHQSAGRSFFTWGWRTPPSLFYLRYLLTRQTVLFLITKCFTAAILMGVCLLYPTDDYDERLIALGCLLAAFSQTAILQHFFFFERIHFDWYRNLPIPVWRWFLNYKVQLALLLVPEALVLLRNYPVGLELSTVVLQLLLMWSMTGVLWYYQGWVNQSNEGGFQLLFFSGIGLALLVMFKVPAWAFVLTGTVVGYGLLSRNFYRVE